MSLKFPSYKKNFIYSEKLESISILGNVHAKKWRWNPFDNSLDLKRLSNDLWSLKFKVYGPSKDYFNGAYSIRFVINHNFRRILKVKSYLNGVWKLKEEQNGETLDNVNFLLKKDQTIELIFNSSNYELNFIVDGSFSEDIEVVTNFKSYELNGFVWDNLNMFEKFNPYLPNRSFEKVSDNLWSIQIPLMKNGGIDFRADGVYQFLISADKEENFGFSGFNNGKGSIVKGCGFSSSNGTSKHSAITVKIFEDGIYKINLINPKSKQPYFNIECVKPKNVKKPVILNDLKNFQILGSIYKQDSFDPTKPHRDLTKLENNIHQIELEVDSGEHSVNFAISNELFLDTMALGCWLDIDELNNGKTNKLSGIAWHGKPHEFNIPFSLDKKTKLKFSYNEINDNFCIETINGEELLKPTLGINNLSIVGDFDKPLEAWDPKSDKNLMIHLGKSQYSLKIDLIANKTYNYKYVGNLSNWSMVFADYELDGYGTDFNGSNPYAENATVKELKLYGQLTSHGNPPALQFQSKHTGSHEFFADLNTGAYSVKYLG